MELKHLCNKIPQYLRKFEGLLAMQGIQFTKNQARLKTLTNKHQGEKAVIIGMGPSLRIEDLERLSGFTTFACNKIYLSFDETIWRPDYYSVNDIYVAKNNREQISSADFKQSQTLHSCIVANELKQHNDPIIFHYLRNIQNLDPARTPYFSKSVQAGIRSGGCSICIDQIQLAYLMGFEEVYLIGIDFNFNIKDSRVVEKSESGDVLASTGEQNHFHKDYRKPGEKWTVPRMEEQKNAFRICREAFEASGRKLFNASRQSDLDEIEKVNFDDVFKS